MSRVACLWLHLWWDHSVQDDGVLILLYPGITTSTCPAILCSDWPILICWVKILLNNLWATCLPPHAGRCLNPGITVTAGKYVDKRHKFQSTWLDDFIWDGESSCTLKKHTIINDTLITAITDTIEFTRWQSSVISFFSPILIQNLKITKM